MAKPIIKIKTGNVKPSDYTETFSGGIVISTSGLSAGELGATITAPNYAFYIGNNLGKAITFGAEVSTDILLGGVNASDFKVATQRALKTYVDDNIVGGPGGSVVQIISRYSTATQSVTTTVPEIGVQFDTQDFISSGGITDLTYVPGSVSSLTAGTFTNNSANTIYLLITYQITWSGFVTTSSYNSRNIVRSAWVQKSFSGSVAADNVYGFTTLLCPPLASNVAGALTGTQNGTAVLELSSGQSFNIRCKNHGAANTSISPSSFYNPSAGFANNFSKATNVQIVKL